jgi:hypothetical protein
MAEEVKEVEVDMPEVAFSKSNRSLASSDDSNSAYAVPVTPGVRPTPRHHLSKEALRSTKFFTNKLPKTQREGKKLCWCIKCQLGQELVHLYNQGFRYVVLFKWIKHFPNGSAIRKKLTIPLVICFWMLVVIGIGWLYNSILYSQSMSMHDDQGTCLSQCILLLGVPCLDEVDEMNSRRKQASKYFFINSVYITFCSLFSLHLVIEVTSSLRSLGVALKNILKKKSFRNISNKIIYSTENATAEMADVMQPIRRLLSQGANYRKRAEMAEARWSEAVRKTEMLEALLHAEEGEATPRTMQEKSLPSQQVIQKDIHRLLHQKSDLNIFVTTWNVGNTCPSSNLHSWLGGTDLCDIVVVGLQECSYSIKSSSSTGNLLSLQDAGSKLLKTTIPNYGCAQHMENLIHSQLGPSFYLQDKVFINGDEAAMKDVAAIRLFVFVKKKHVGWVKTCTKSVVRRGYKMTLNKGAVAISLIVYGIRVCLINSHFQAHQTKVEERNSDYTEICKKLFTRKNIIDGQHPFDMLTPDKLTPTDPGLCHHVVFWMGDLNYRIDLPHEEIVSSILKCQDGQEEWFKLFQFDQLNQQRVANRAFHGYSEDFVEFMPTYKLNGDRTGYDLRRTPAWCDRILYKAVEGIHVQQLVYDADCMSSTSDHHPVTTSFRMSNYLPIFDSGMKDSLNFVRLSMSQLQMSFFDESVIGNVLFKRNEKIISKSEAETEPSLSDVLTLSGDGNRGKDISKVAPCLMLTCCGVVIQRVATTSWFTNDIVLKVGISSLLHLSHFPEPISIGIYLCDLNQMTPRQSLTSISNVETQDHGDVDVTSSPIGGFIESIEHQEVENPKILQSSCIAEGLVETLDLFQSYRTSKEGSVQDQFTIDLLYAGLKVGTMAGTLAASDGVMERENRRAKP